METREQELTPRERAYLEHVRCANEQKLTLVEYCQQRGLSPRSLYGAKTRLVQRGVLPRTLKPKQAAPEKFVAVRVAGPVASANETVCRVRHPSGCVIECASWPQASWVSQLMGVGDASA